jgi:hypothetical protein
MKRFIKILVLACLGVGATKALADSVKFKGNTVLAHWSQGDACSQAETQLVGFDLVEKTQSDGTVVNTFKEFRLSISKFNFCTGNIDIFAFQQDSGTVINTYKIASNLSDARFVATIPVLDSITGTTINMKVDVTVTATDAATTRKSKFTSRTPSGSTSTRSLDIQRPGQATGTISDGINNYTYGNSDFANLAYAKNGQFNSIR